ncbi:MAG TPA: ornithine carbamoyltransferase [Aggregatilineaceae bacterium]|nr:ornithine carbamoyltransferase [Aggregatilineaceae bacterium]
MRHFLEISDWSSTELDQLIRLAVQLKLEWRSGGNRPVLGGKALGMIFEKPSLRTRVSFEMGMLHLGGHALYLSPAEIGLGQRESIADVARVLSSYTQGIMARVFDPAHITELAHWSCVPVINGLSDRSHPCQVMADILTLYEHFGHLRGLHLAYIGDFNNVAFSLGEAAVRFGLSMTAACPEGFGPSAAARDHLKTLGLDLIVHTDPAKAVAHADVIYTDTWVSMGQEAETSAREKAFPPYQVNAELLSKAPGHAVVMHCLPAHRGYEITDDVADGAQSLLFPQAENRLHAQKAILVQLMSGY